MKENIYDKNKPLIEMDELEMTRAFDDLGSSIHQKMLEGARTGDTESTTAAIILLTTEDGAHRVVSWAAEYGDGEGIRMERDTLRSISRNRLLKPKEKLDLVVVDLDFSGVNDQKSLLTLRNR